jgi:hypothetical protein
MLKVVLVLLVILAIAILIVIIALLGLRLAFGSSSINLPGTPVSIDTLLCIVLSVVAEIVVILLAAYFVRNMIASK